MNSICFTLILYRHLKAFSLLPCVFIIVLSACAVGADSAANSPSGPSDAEAFSTRSIGLIPVGSHQIELFENVGRPSDKVIILPLFNIGTTASVEQTAAYSAASPSINAVSSDIAPNKIVLRLTIEVNNQIYIRRLVEEMRRLSLMLPEASPNKALYAGMTSDRIIPAGIKRVVVDDASIGKLYKFERIVLDDHRGDIPLVMIVDREHVDRVKEEIRRGEYAITIKAFVFAQRAVSEVSGTISVSSIKNLNSFRSIVGNSDSPSWLERHVTRDQLIDLKGRLGNEFVQELVLFGKVSDANKASVISAMGEFLSTLFKEKTLFFHNPNDFEALDGHGFARKDMDPGKICEFGMGLKDSLKTKTDTEIKASTSADVLSVFKGDMKFDSKWLKENESLHELQLKIEGEMVIPVGLKVHSLSRSSLVSSTRLVSVVLEYESIYNPKSFHLFSASVDSRGHSSDVLSATYAQAVAAKPVSGMIMPFVGGPVELEAAISRGWEVCDGRTVSDLGANPYWRGKNTPDLRDKFLRAAAMPNLTGGSDSARTSSDGAHQHAREDIRGATPYPGHRWFGDDNADSQHRNAPDGAHSHTVVTLPAFYTVVYLIYVR